MIVFFGNDDDSMSRRGKTKRGKGSFSKERREMLKDEMERLIIYTH